jgi:hypothetical protein
MPPEPTNPAGQPGGTPAGAPAAPTYGEWFQKLPEPIRGQIPPETLKEINEGWLRQQDYTKKTQEIADLRKVAGDRDLKKELDELEQWRGWRTQHWPSIEARLKASDKPTGGAGKDGGGGKPTPRLFKATPDDFYDQDKLDTTLSQLEQQFAGSATQAFQSWYQEKELPRLDKVVESYVNWFTGLFELIWPADKLPPIKELLREAVARGELDAPKIAKELGTKRKETEDAAYQRGLEEGRRAAGQTPPSPAPPGAGMPSWSPPKGAAKTEEAMFSEVMEEVSKRHGPLPV